MLVFQPVPLPLQRDAVVLLLQLAAELLKPEVCLGDAFVSFMGLITEMVL
jgi:hypothetical protein